VTEGEGTRRADIQGLRALAVVLVVLYHADLGFSGGFVGVDVFFVISGFVITGLLTRELGRSGGLRLGRFYLRRIRRLIPALALVIVVVALVSIVAAPVGIQPIAARTGGAASLFLGNLYLYSTPSGYFAIDATTNPFLHMWSLAVEEQFYLVFPLVLLGAWRVGARRARPRTASAVALAVVSLVSFALAVAMVDGTTFPGVARPREFAFFSSITRAWEFGAGALLALAAVRLRRVLRPVVAEGVAIVGLGAVLLAALRFDDLTPFPGVNALLPVGGAVLLIAAGCGGRAALGPTFTNRPAVWIGDISYSWYLWHWPLIVFARATWPGSWAAPVAAFGSIVPAWLSYHFVENPIRRSEALTGRRTLAMGAAAILAGIVACGGLVLGHRWVITTPGYESVQRALRTHDGCPRADDAGTREPRRPDEPVDSRRCTWTAPGAVGAVALLGDSNAGHLLEPVRGAARDYDRSVYRAAANGCPFADVTLTVLGERRDDCRSFYERSMEAVLASSPDLVVIGSTTTRYLDEGQFQMQVGRDGPRARDPDAKAVAWERGLRRTVRRLARAGIPTLVVHPIPKFPGWDLRACAAGRVVLDEFTCGRSTDRAGADADRAAALAAEGRAIAGARDVDGVDLSDLVCRDGTCATDRDGVWLYHDGDHLSIDGADTLRDVFVDAFAPSLRG
jgi:peptidoglycan/LPS O-acetylase OafA/YrhL